MRTRLLGPGGPTRWENATGCWKPGRASDSQSEPQEIGEKSSRTKHPSSNSLQPVPVSGAKAQENRRKDKTDAGLCRVETWVPSQVAQHMKAKAKSQKMTGQEFLAKLITENLAKT